MMKKLTLVSLLSTLSCSTLVHADCMGGGCAASALNGGAAFFGLEGGYSKKNVDGYNFTVFPNGGTVTSQEDNNPYVFRISAGMMTPVDDQFAISGEIGWGFYGKTTLTPIFSSSLSGFFVPGALTSSYNIYGFDALAGVVFTQPSFNVFLKAGALIEGVKVKTNANFYAFNEVDNFNSTSNSTSVLPEFKIGGTYNFNENWGLTLSYMYAFGGSPGVSGSYETVTDVSTLTVNTESPSISAVMFGVQVLV